MNDKSLKPPFMHLLATFLNLVSFQRFLDLDLDLRSEFEVEGRTCPGICPGTYPCICTCPGAYPCIYPIGELNRLGTPLELEAVAVVVAVVVRGGDEFERRSWC